VGKFFTDLGTSISTAFSNAWNAVKTAWGKVVSWFTTTIINPVKTAFQNLVQNIKNIFTNFSWRDIGRNIVDGIKNGIQNAWSGLKTWVTNAFDGLVDGVKDFLGIHSPSTVFMEIGGYTIEGLEVGIDKQTVSAANTMRESMNRIVSSASAQSGRIANQTSVTIDRNESGSSYDDSAAMAEQNALLREQNRIMEQLLRKESSVVISPSAALGRVVSQSQKQYAALAGG
jgi:phage-related protein